MLCIGNQKHAHNEVMPPKPVSQKWHACNGLHLVAMPELVDNLLEVLLHVVILDPLVLIDGEKSSQELHGETSDNCTCCRCFHNNQHGITNVCHCSTQ